MRPDSPGVRSRREELLKSSISGGTRCSNSTCRALPCQALPGDPVETRRPVRLPAELSLSSEAPPRPNHVKHYRP